MAVDTISTMLSTGRVKGTGKKKIEVKAIEKKDQRMVTFSKRRQGLVKKLTGYASLLKYFFAVIVFSPMGRLYFNGDPEVIKKYRKFSKKRETEKKKILELEGQGKNKDKENLLRWLRELRPEECDDVEKLDILKKKLGEIKEKVAKKLADNATAD